MLDAHWHRIGGNLQRKRFLPVKAIEVIRSGNRNHSVPLRGQSHVLRLAASGAICFALADSLKVVVK